MSPDPDCAVCNGEPLFHRPCSIPECDHEESCSACSGIAAAPVDPRNGPIHTWFSLSYAAYLVLPRSVLQSMPIEWQERFVSCLNQLQDAAAKADVETPAYTVYARERGRFVEDPYRPYRHAPNWLTHKDGGPQ